MLAKMLREIASLWNQEGLSIWKQEDKKYQFMIQWNQDLWKDNIAVLNDQWEAYLQSVERRAGLSMQVCQYDQWLFIFTGSLPLPEKEFRRFSPLIVYAVEACTKNDVSEHYRVDLDTMAEITHTIVSSIQDENILDFILKSAINRIASADTGFLFLFEEKINKLVIKSATGFHQESYELSRLGSGEGISGQVFATQKPLLVSGRKQIAQAMSNMTKRNMKLYLASTIHDVFPKSVISVPLQYQSKCIGVLTLDNFLNDKMFTDEDLQLLQGFADLASVVIEHSRLFHQVNRQNRELSLIHQALQNEHERLQKMIEYHNRLTNIAAKGQGIDSLLQALHRMVKVPMAVFDPLFVLISTSPESFTPSLPNDFLRHPAVKRVNQTRKWQKVNLSKADEMILITPIIGTNKLLGYLCAWTASKKSLEDVGKLMLEYGATVFALEWIKKEAIRESQERMKGQLWEDMLAGEMNQQLIEQAGILGLKKNHHYAVMLIQTIKNQTDRVADLIEMAWPSMSQIHHLVVSRSNYTAVILSFSKDLTIEQREKSLRLIMRGFGKFAELRVAIGRIYQGLLKMEQSYKEASKCLELFQQEKNEGNALYYGDLGITRFFLQQDKTELLSYLHEVLDPIIIYDQKKNSKLLETLLAYVKYDKDLGSVTKELNIHYNTLYYRINRIQELLGFSFHQTEEWFNVKLACRIYMYFR